MLAKLRAESAFMVTSSLMYLLTDSLSVSTYIKELATINIIDSFITNLGHNWLFKVFTKGKIWVKVPSSLQYLQNSGQNMGSMVLNRTY